MNYARGRSPVHHPNMMTFMDKSPSRSWMGEPVYYSRPHTAVMSGTTDALNYEYSFKNRRGHFVEMEKIYPQEFYRSHDCRITSKKEECCSLPTCPFFCVGSDARVCEKCYLKFIRNHLINDSDMGASKWCVNRPWSSISSFFL